MTIQDITEQAAQILVERHSIEQNAGETAVVALAWSLGKVPIEETLVEYTQVVLDLQSPNPS